MNARWLSGLLLLILLAGCAHLGLSEGQEYRLQQVASEMPPAGEPVFHVIGLYRGLPPPWHDENACRVLSDPECQRGMQHRVIHEVDINVTDTRHPVILGLSAYENTHWRVRSAPGVQIQRVILSGRYPQSVSGLNPAVPVEAHVEEPGPCPAGHCVTTDAGFWDHQAPAQRYSELVNLPPTSFTGAQERGWVEIGPETAGIR